MICVGGGCNNVQYYASTQAIFFAKPMGSQRKAQYDTVVHSKHTSSLPWLLWFLVIYFLTDCVWLQIPPFPHNTTKYHLNAASCGQACPGVSMPAACSVHLNIPAAELEALANGPDFNCSIVPTPVNDSVIQILQFTSVSGSITPSNPSICPCFWVHV